MRLNRQGLKRRLTPNERRQQKIEAEARRLSWKNESVAHPTPSAVSMSNFPEDVVESPGKHPKGPLPPSGFRTPADEADYRKRRAAMRAPLSDTVSYLVQRGIDSTPYGPEAKVWTERHYDRQRAEGRWIPLDERERIVASMDEKRVEVIRSDHTKRPIPRDSELGWPV